MRKYCSFVCTWYKIYLCTKSTYEGKSYFQCSAFIYSLHAWLALALLTALLSTKQVIRKYNKDILKNTCSLVLNSEKWPIYQFFCKFFNVPYLRTLLGILNVAFHYFYKVFISKIIYLHIFQLYNWFMKE